MIIVVLPVRPGGTFAARTLVEEGITIKSEPLLKIALAPEIITGDGAIAAKVVGCGTITNVCPPISVVCPPSPGGTAFTGMVVGEGIITFGGGMGLGCGLDGGVPV